MDSNWKCNKSPTKMLNFGIVYFYRRFFKKKTWLLCLDNQSRAQFFTHLFLLIYFLSKVKLRTFSLIILSIFSNSILLSLDSCFTFPRIKLSYRVLSLYNKLKWRHFWMQYCIFNGILKVTIHHFNSTCALLLGPPLRRLLIWNSELVAQKSIKSVYTWKYSYLGMLSRVYANAS